MRKGKRRINDTETNRRVIPMDQVTEQRLDQPADLREELVIDQRQGSRAPAPTQLLTSEHLGQTLATSTGDSDSQRNIGENSEEAQRHKKRINDQNYRQRKKDKNKALEDENDQLKRDKDEQQHRINSLVVENEKLKGELEEKKHQYNSLLDRITGANEQSMSTTHMQQFRAEVKLAISSLNQKVDGLQQNITQLSGPLVYPQPWQPPSGGLISQDSQAAAITLPQSPPSGTSRMQQPLQSPGIFTDDSHGLPGFLPQQQLRQTGHPIDVLPGFSVHQEQGVNFAIESQPSTYRLSDNYQFSSQYFAFDPAQSPRHRCFLESTGFQTENRKRERALGRNHARSTKQTILEGLEAENTRLKREDQKMKSNIQAFEAEHTRLKCEIEEKEQLMKSYLEAFEAEIGILMPEIEKMEQIMKYNLEAFEAENGLLKHKIEENKRLMKSNMEAFEAKNGELKLKIGEEEQPMKSNLESFEAENERLKHETEQKKQLMKSNLKAFEARDGKLKHEIQEKQQLVKSNLETFEAQIRQLVDVFKFLNVTNVAVNSKDTNTSGELAKGRKNEEEEEEEEEKMPNTLN